MKESKILKIRGNEFKKIIGGFTLIELIVVIAVLGILAGIAVPRFVGYVQHTKRVVCRTNTSTIERLYHAKLDMDELEHSESIFEVFLLEYLGGLCPENGFYTYSDENVSCSVHMDSASDSGESDDGSGSDEEEEVPYL